MGAVLGIIGVIGAHRISGPSRPRLPYGFTPFEVGVPSVDVEFTAADGTRLAGWWLSHDDPPSHSHAGPHADPRGDSPSDATGETHARRGRMGTRRPVVIVSHGHRGSRQDMLGIGSGLWREGFDVLLYDFRGNGDSGDGPQSLAHYEQQDLEAAVDLVAELRPAAPIHLVGFSMGAATSILVAARDPRIRRVVADSPFADLRGVVAATIGHLRLPPVPLLDLVDHATRLRYGYRFADVEPIEAVAGIAPRPLLIVHGTGDSVIPVEHAHRLAAAAGEGSRLEVVEGVEHCGTYFADRPGHIARVASFLRD